MSIDLKTWLLEQGYDEATATELAPKLAANAAAVANIESSTMRQADYSREKDKLVKAQSDLETANNRLSQEMAEWAQVQAEGGQVTAKMQRDLESAQAKVATLTQRVTNIATQAGMDPSRALEGLETVVTQPITPAPANSFDPTKFEAAHRDQYAGLTRLALTLPAELFDIATEHQSLFGKPLNTSEISTEILTRAQTKGNQKSLNPRDVWEEKHGVTAKRQEVSAAERAAEIKAAEQRGREAALSEQMLPGQPAVTGRPQSPLFAAQRKSVLDRPQPGQVAQRAAAALRSGKYREGSTTTQ